MRQLSVRHFSSACAVALLAFCASAFANDYWVCQEAERVRYVKSEQAVERSDDGETTSCTALYYSSARKMRPLWRSRHIDVCRRKAEKFIRSQTCAGGTWLALVPMGQYLSTGLSTSNASRVADFRPIIEALLKFTDVLKFDYDWVRGHDSHEDAVTRLAARNIMRVDEGRLSKDDEKVSLVAIKGTCGTSSDYCQNVLVAWDGAARLTLLGDFGGQLVLMPRDHDPATGLPSLVISENVARLSASCLTMDLEFYQRLPLGSTGRYDRPKRFAMNPEACPA